MYRDWHVINTDKTIVTVDILGSDIQAVNDGDNP